MVYALQSLRRSSCTQGAHPFEREYTTHALPALRDLFLSTWLTRHLVHRISMPCGTDGGHRASLRPLTSGAGGAGSGYAADGHLAQGDLTVNLRQTVVLV